MLVEIINDESFFGGNSQKIDFEKANIKIGDKIEINRGIISNAVFYKYNDDDVIVIYTWNFKKVE